MEVRGWKGGVPRHKCFRSSKAGSTLRGLIMEVCASMHGTASLMVKRLSISIFRGTRFKVLSTLYTGATSSSCEWPREVV